MRFSAGLGRPPQIRRQLAGPASVRPASGFGPVRPPLWWLPNEHGGSPVWGDGNRGDGNRAPVRIPDRLLRRAAGRVPAGGDRQPGSAGVAMTGKTVPVRRIPDVQFSGPMRGAASKLVRPRASGRHRRCRWCRRRERRRRFDRYPYARSGFGQAEWPGHPRTGWFRAERPGRFTRGGGSAGATAGGRRNPPFRRPRRPPIIGFHDAEVRRRCSPGGSRSGSRGRSGSLDAARGAGSIAGNYRKPVWAVDRVGHAPNRIGAPRVGSDAPRVGARTAPRVGWQAPPVGSAGPGVTGPTRTPAANPGSAPATARRVGPEQNAATIRRAWFVPRAQPLPAMRPAPAEPPPGTPTTQPATAQSLSPQSLSRYHVFIH